MRILQNRPKDAVSPVLVLYGEACSFCFIVDFESRKKVLAPAFWDWLLSSSAYFRGDKTDPSLSPPLPPGRKSHRTLESFLHKETEYIVVKTGSGKTIIESSSEGRSVNCNRLQDLGTRAKKMPAKMVSRLPGLQSGTGG